MRPVKVINVVDTHTAGEPTRVVIGGIPFIPGKDLQKKKAWLARENDSLRRLLMHEPRGHRDMFGAIITPPTSDDVDLDVVFMDCDGYLDMCGHASIGVVTVLLELNIIAKTEVVINTPAGKIFARAKRDKDGVRQVTIRNVPSFFHSSESIQLKRFGKVKIDVAYGGNFFALIPVEQLDLELSLENVHELIETGMEIKHLANERVKLFDTIRDKESRIEQVEIYDDHAHPHRNVTVFGRGQLDRSPCGTGTCAKMALLNSQGKLKKGEEYIYQSLLGTEFKGRIISETNIGGHNAIIPEITGSASITGMQQLIVDKSDPLRDGFRLL